MIKPHSLLLIHFMPKELQVGCSGWRGPSALYESEPSKRVA